MLTQLPDRPIAFQPSYVRVTGSITGALLLSQAMYWHKRTKDPQGWWYKTMEEWQDETMMSRSEFETARKACGSILLMEKRGIPAKCYYKINESALQTRLQESCKLECGNPANSDAGIPQPTNITETTSEITTETTGRNGGEFTLQRAMEWRKQACIDGADYNEAETKSAFLALQAGGWRWGKGVVMDHRAALERQIQTDREMRYSRRAKSSEPEKEEVNEFGLTARQMSKKPANMTPREWKGYLMAIEAGQ